MKEINRSELVFVETVYETTSGMGSAVYYVPGWRTNEFIEKLNEPEHAFSESDFDYQDPYSVYKHQGTEDDFYVIKGEDLESAECCDEVCKCDDDYETVRSGYLTIMLLPEKD